MPTERDQHASRSQRPVRRASQSARDARFSSEERMRSVRDAVAANQAHEYRNRVIAALAIFVVLATAIVMMVPAISVTSDTIGEGFSEPEMNIVDYEGGDGSAVAKEATEDIQADQASDATATMPRKAAKRGALYAVVDSSGTFEAATEASGNNIDLDSFYDHAIYYGIVANNIDYPNNIRTNFAANYYRGENVNGINYGQRCQGSEPVSSILGTASAGSGQRYEGGNRDTYFYVPEEYMNLVGTNHAQAIERNADEIRDKVELLITRTLAQAERFEDIATKSPDIVITEPGSGITLQVDTTKMPDNTTIYVDITDTQNLDHPIKIDKLPGQTIVFNANGKTVHLPHTTQVTVHNSDGSTIFRKAVDNADSMTYAVDGEIWKHIIWNCPNATSIVAQNDIGGVILAHNPDSTIQINKGVGWIISAGTVKCTNEWYGFPGTDVPFRSVTITKVFHGVGAVTDIDPNFYIDIRTNANRTTNTSDAELIDRLVITGQNTSNANTENGKKYTELGYATREVDANAKTVTYTWTTQELAVGNEHSINEANAKVLGKDPMGIGISTWDLVLDTSTHTVHWDNMVVNATDVAKAVGFFGISDTLERNAATVDNYYEEKDQYELSVTKKATGEGYRDNEEYTFTIELLDEKGNVVTGDRKLTFEKYSSDGATKDPGSIDTTYKNNVSPAVHSGQFTLAIGQKIVFTNIPKGWHYKITEEKSASSKYQVFYTSCDGVLNWDKNAVVTNSYEPPTAPLVVTKTVNDPSLLPDGFQILVSQDGSSTATKLTAGNSDSRSTSNGQVVYTWTLEKCPIGAEYTLEEQNALRNDYTMTSTAIVNGNISVSERKAQIKIAEGADANRVDFTNIYERNSTDDGLYVTKKWLASDGVTDISSAVTRDSVKFQLYFAYDQYNKGLVKEYTIRRDGGGSWIPVSVDLPDDPKNWGRHCGYYLVELDEAGNAIGETNLVAYEYKGQDVSLNSLIPYDSAGTVTIVNKSEEKANEIEVVKKWEGSFSDIEKTAQVQLRRVKKTTGDPATIKIVHAWNGGYEYLSEVGAYSDGSQISVGDTVRVSYGQNRGVYSVESGYSSGASGVNWDSGQRTIAFKITANNAVIAINGDKKPDIVTSIDCVDSEVDYSSTSSTPEDYGAPVTLDASNSWYCKWTDLPAGYTYFVEEVSPGAGVSVSYSYKGDDVPENGIGKGLITVTNTKEGPQTGSVRVAKTFEGIDAMQIPDDFTISATWEADGTQERTLSLSGDQQDGVTLAAEGMTYTWTIEGIPLGTPVTFVESNYEVEGYSVSTQPEANANGQVVAQATADSTPGTAQFVNTYAKVEEPTLDVVIKKQGDKGEALPGAVFELYRHNGTVYEKLTGGEYGWLAPDDSFTVPAEGFTLRALKDGVYQLKELVAPDGYVIQEDTPVAFTVQDGRILQNANVLRAGAKYVPASGSVLDTYIVLNTPGRELPSTGGPGLLPFYALAVLLLALAASLAFVSRKARPSR